jgi:hypothetical protein
MHFLDRSSTRLVILACSGTKRPGADAWRQASWETRTNLAEPAPVHMRAFDRYDGPLWQTLRAANPDAKLAQVAYLSARYGFGHADHAIKDYDARLTDERADELIERGIEESWPKSARKGGIDGLSAIQGMATITGGWNQTLTITDVALVGGGTYLRVMRAFVEAFQAKGYIAADATVTEINAPIGFMRQELRAWLGVPLSAAELPAPAVELDELAGELVAQSLLPGVAPITQVTRELAELERRRAARRGAAALPAGGLFDECAKRQGELF